MTVIIFLHNIQPVMEYYYSSVISVKFRLNSILNGTFYMSDNKADFYSEFNNDDFGLLTNQIY